MLRRSGLIRRSVIRSYSTKHFRCDSRLVSKIDYNSLNKVLVDYQKYTQYYMGQRLNRIKDDPAEHERNIRRDVPTIVKICQESPHTLTISEKEGIYDITHTPLPHVVPEESKYCGSLGHLASQIRCLSYLEEFDWRYPKPTIETIELIWPKIYAHYNSVYGNTQKWPLIEGRWIYSMNADCPIETIRSDLRTWSRHNRADQNFYHMFSVINDVIRYGNDGYVILKHFLDRYENEYALWRFDQDYIVDRVEMATKGFAILEQIQRGISIEEIARQFPEGKLDNFPYPAEQRVYFDRLYAYVMPSQERKEEFRNCGQPSQKLMEYMGKHNEERIIYWELHNIRTILKKGWHAFLCDRIRRVVLKKES